MARIEPTDAVRVAVGGAAGASLRWGVAEAWPHAGAFPWPTFVVNVVGCFVLGAVVRRRDERLLLAVGTGFCGGLTTFSTFAVQLATFLDDGRVPLAALYLVSSLVAGVTAYRVGRTWR